VGVSARQECGTLDGDLTPSVAGIPARSRPAMTEIAARLKTHTLSEGVEVKGKRSHFSWERGHPALEDATKTGRPRSQGVTPGVNRYGKGCPTALSQFTRSEEG